MNFQALHKQRKYILVLAAIGAISVFLPWFTISAEGLGVRISDSESGFHGTGILVFFAFIGTGIVALAGIKPGFSTKQCGWQPSAAGL